MSWFLLFIVFCCAVFESILKYFLRGVLGVKRMSIDVGLLDLLWNLWILLIGMWRKLFGVVFS